MATFQGKWFPVLLAMLLSACVVGCATTGGQNNSAGIAANVVYEVPDSVQIEKVAYFYEDYKGSPRLHFEVTLKNVTQEPKRFRLNILLPEGPAVGGMYPRKAGAIEPGQSLTRKCPVYVDQSKLPGMFLPSGYTMMVKEL